MVVEGVQFLERAEDGTTSPVTMGADGIAISADGSRLFYCPLASRRWHSVATEALFDRSLGEDEVAATVADEGDKGAVGDGMETDDAGRLYVTDGEHNAIHRRSADGSWETVVHDPRLLWPDSMSVAADRHPYVTANQLYRQEKYQGGQDRRHKPTRSSGSPSAPARSGCGRKAQAAASATHRPRSAGPEDAVDPARLPAEPHIQAGPIAIDRRGPRAVAVGLGPVGDIVVQHHQDLARVGVPATGVVPPGRPGLVVETTHHCPALVVELRAVLGVLRGMAAASDGDASQQRRGEPPRSQGPRCGRKVRHRRAPPAR